jgi:outer membrane biosynthesis protein TonB
MPRKLFTFATLLLFVAPLALAQTPAPPPAAPPASESTPMKIGGDVLPPVLTHSAEPKFAHGAAHKQSDDVILVGLIVDKAGKPTNIHIVRSSDPAFDKVSTVAVSKYRFKPATLHGEPVAVELLVQVNFHSY